MIPQHRATLPSVALGLLCFAVPAVARAQSSEDLAVRRVALDRAEAAHNAGHHEEALLLAERAGTLQMTTSLRYFLAREHAELRHFTAALLGAQECIREGTQGTAPGREALVAACRALVQQAQSEVASLVFVLPSPEPEGLEVRVASQVVRGARLSLPYVVDPGRIVIEATAPGHQPFRTEVVVESGANLPLRLTLDRLVEAPPRRPPQPPPNEGIGAGPFVVLGGGGALLATSLVTWILRNQAATGCVEETGTLPSGARGTAWFCDTSTQRDTARDGVPLYEALSVTFLATGAAAVAAGSAWALARALRRPPSDEQATVRVVPTIAGLMVVGRWSL